MNDLRETVLDHVGTRKHGKSQWEWIKKNPSAHQKQLANAYWITDTAIRAVIEALAAEAEDGIRRARMMRDYGMELMFTKRIADLREHLPDPEATHE